MRAQVLHPQLGLHFTKELLDEIRKRGVEIVTVTLHVGIGTFRPVKVENIEEHNMHSEHFYINKENADKINKAKREGNKIIACGTTSCRVLESISDENRTSTRIRRRNLNIHISRI